jgi:hypothetical protein
MHLLRLLSNPPEALGKLPDDESPRFESDY